MTSPAQEPEPELHTSPLSSSVDVEGWHFDVEIYRLEHETQWVLDIVDEAGSSNVWEERFASDEEARAEALAALESEGARGFVDREYWEHAVDEHPALALQFAATAAPIPVSEALGMMAALASAPTVSNASTWIQTIVGDAAFGSSPDAQAFVGELMLSYNAIVARLDAGHGAAPPSRDPEVVRSWCYGYIQAAREDDAWLEDEAAVVALIPLGLLAGLLDNLSSEPGDDVDSEERRAGSIRVLPELVAEIHEYWAEARVDQAALAAARADDGVYRREAPKVGRNAPCPCNSGKKYKRCCGAT